MRTLLVEDDLDLASLVQLVLEGAGHHVRHTDRVAGIADLAVEAGADVVLCDGVLLDGTIEDVLDALDADPRTAALPVVVCSVRPDAVDHPRIIGRLRKPVAPAGLATRLEEAVAGPAPAPTDPTGGDLEGLRQRALQELDRRAGVLADHAAAVLVGDATERTRRAAERAAHQCVGLAGALERPGLATAAARAEQLLRESSADRRVAAELCELAVQLEDGSRRPLDAAVASGDRRGRGRHVVIVDDDVALAALLSRRLQDAGFTTSIFHDGRRALTELRAPGAAGEVVLLDVDLPGLSGLAVLAALRREGALAGRRVVLSTVHGTDAELLRLLTAAEVHHLPKPFELDRVVELTQDLADELDPATVSV